VTRRAEQGHILAGLISTLLLITLGCAWIAQHLGLALGG
jgi:hypothetical protein